LLITGGAITVKVDEAVFPVPPLVEETEPLVLALLPADVPVTITDTVHVPPPVIVPLENEMLDAPAAGENVGLPQPEVLALGMSATFRPLGKVSEKTTPVSESLGFGLVIVNVSVLVPLSRIGLGEKVFEMLGGRSAASVAFAEFPVSTVLLVAASMKVRWLEVLL